MRRSTIAVGIVLLLLGSVASATAAAGATNAAATQDDSLSCEFPYTGVDASGTEVTVEQEPERVVTLNPSAAQTVWEIGGSEKVVGVSAYASFLDGAGDLPVVQSGYPATVNVERIIKLDPGLVLAPNTIDNESVQQVRDAGIPVYRFELADSIQSIYRKTELIGELTGECSGAEDVVASMQDRVSTIEEAVQGEPKPDVFWGTSAGYTAGPNTFIGKAIAKAGGHNIATAAANDSRAYPQLSAEVIAAQDPEYVVVSVSPSQMGNEPRSYVPKGSVVRNTTAYEEGNIVVVNTNNLSQPAPRVVTPMTKFAKAFHPEAYAEANAPVTTTGPDATTDDTTSDSTSTAATSEEATATDGSTTAATTTAGEPTTATTSTSNGTSPGFGVPVALVAVLAAALFARR